MKPKPNIHERFIRQIWGQKHLCLDDLKTIDGQRVEILDVGVPNRDSGPDFKHAKLRIGGVTYEGDVEIHKTMSDWLMHTHSNDPKYNQVVLHAVMWGDVSLNLSFSQSGRKIPVLILGDFLDDSFQKVWEKAINEERETRQRAIKCFQKNGSVPLNIKMQWLDKLGLQRLDMRVRRYKERLKELVDEHRLVVKEPGQMYGDISELPPPVHTYTQKDFSAKHLWEQLLYEGIMEGLGYSKNREPFLRLSRNLTLQFIKEQIPNVQTSQSTVRLQSMFFGAAGLIPEKVGKLDNSTKQCVRELNSVWEQIKPNYKREMLHAADWHFFRLRPRNFPTVRLAGASSLVMKFFTTDFLKAVIYTIKGTAFTPGHHIEKLVELFQAETTGYWMNHYRFGDEEHGETKQLIGRERIGDIIINAVLPVAFLYAKIFDDEKVRAGVLNMYNGFPALGDNEVTSAITKQLFEDDSTLKGAKYQQGAIHLYRFYCAYERCKQCEVGKLVFTQNARANHH
jgi:hypothetical protein